MTWPSAAVSKIAAKRDAVAMPQVYHARNCANATVWLGNEKEHAFFSVYQKNMIYFYFAFYKVH